MSQCSQLLLLLLARLGSPWPYLYDDYPFSSLLMS